MGSSGSPSASLRLTALLERSRPSGWSAPFSERIPPYRCSYGDGGTAINRIYLRRLHGCQIATMATAIGRVERKSSIGLLIPSFKNRRVDRSNSGRPYIPAHHRHCCRVFAWLLSRGVLEKSQSAATIWSLHSAMTNNLVRKKRRAPAQPTPKPKAVPRRVGIARVSVKTSS
jgi:hypothetical protein